MIVVRQVMLRFSFFAFKSGRMLPSISVHLPPSHFSAGSMIPVLSNVCDCHYEGVHDLGLTDPSDPVTVEHTVTDSVVRYGVRRVNNLFELSSMKYPNNTTTLLCYFNESCHQLIIIITSPVYTKRPVSYTVLERTTTRSWSVMCVPNPGRV